jgi:hypothetical protein
MLPTTETVWAEFNLGLNEKKLVDELPFMI